jgi:hypothetical protein
LYVDWYDWWWRRQFPQRQPWRWLGELPRRGAGGDTDAGVDGVKIALAVLIAVALTGCSGLPKDGRYQTGGGGWDNFRAEVGEATTERST